MSPRRLGLWMMLGLLAYVAYDQLVAGGSAGRAHSDYLVVLSGENFTAEVLEAAQPVLVDFYADWCGPCRRLAPTLADLADTWQDRIRVAKLNVDQARELAGQYHVQNIPCLILFQDGKEVDRHVGLARREDLQRWVESRVKGA